MINHKFKVNLGCGENYKNGYLNIDLYSNNPMVKIANIINLNFIKDKSVDEVFAKDVLEHFCIIDAKKALKEWTRILKSGGLLYLQTTNIDKQIEAYLKGVWSIEDFNYMLFAGVNWSNSSVKPEDYHKCSLNFNIIKKILAKNKTIIESVKYDEIDDKLIKSPRCHNLNMIIISKKL